MSNGSSDRQWPLPSSPWIMRMWWHDLAFLHWKVDPAVLTRHIPPELEVDLYDGDAWIGVVPFRMSGVSPRLFPDIPWVSAFPELNVRTYVTHDNKPGVWFFSLDATNPLAVRVARTTFHLNYLDANIALNRRDGWIDYQSKRTHRNMPSASLKVSYRANGEPFCAEPGSLEFFLTARYCLYAANRRGKVFRGDIDHENWKLRRGESQITDNNMTNGLRIDIPGSPDSTLLADDIFVRGWKLKAIDSFR